MPPAATMPKDAARPCRTCLYWRAGLIVVVAALLVTWLVRALSA